MPAPRRTVLFALGCLACLAARAPAQVSTPGSLLLYPEYDSRPGSGIINLITVTNTEREGPSGVDTEWNYVNGEDCTRVDFFMSLGPGDTFTTITRSHNPLPGHGYLFIVAIDDDFGPARVHNHLIGTSTVLNGIHTFDYTVQPLAFEGIGDGQHTDLDGDGNQDLDGQEYTRVADQVVIPRFYGQDFVESRLIMIDLTGGAGFWTDLLFLIHNDNSEKFTVEHTFECWERIPVVGVSSVFFNWYLATTNHDPAEILGIPQWEAGWLSIDGVDALSDDETIQDPAVLVFLVERSDEWESGGAPFGSGRQNNGGLHHLGSELDREPGVGYCFGDPGVGTPCPCNNDNDGSIPGSGCDNGVFASGANLFAIGQASVSVDTLALVTKHAEPNNACLFFQGNTRVNGGNGITYGDGLRCAGGGVSRLQVAFSNGAGRARTTVALGAKVGAEPGDLSRYQCWYRSTTNPACGPVNFFNTSNGYELMWMP